MAIATIIYILFFIWLFWALSGDSGGRSREFRQNYFSQYASLRKQISETAEYQEWRQSIFRIYGRKCSGYGCNSTTNLEIHHPIPFGRICYNHNITTVQQALACPNLWRLDNGVVVCKSCHNQLDSSINYHKYN